MKTSELIKQLQELDPAGEMEVEVSIYRTNYDGSGERIDEVKLDGASHQHVKIMVEREVRFNSGKARFYWTM